MLLNIQETLSPLDEDTPLIDGPASATDGDQDEATHSVEMEDAEMSQFSQQVVLEKGHFAVQVTNFVVQKIQKETEPELEDLCEPEETKEDIAPSQGLTENIAPTKRERSPSQHQQNEKLKAS